MDTDDFTTSEWMTIGGGLAAVIGAVLPWVSFSLGSVTGIDGDGVFTLVFGIIAGAIVLFRNWETVDVAAVGVLGVLTLLIGANVYNNLSGMTGRNILNVSAGIGLHLTMLGGLLLVAGAAYGYTQSGTGHSTQVAGGR